MRFNFTGNAYVETDQSKKTYFDRSGTTKIKEDGSGGDPYTSIQFSVASDKNNRGYVELFGMKKEKINTMGTDGEQLEIDWDSRNDEEVLKLVANKSVANFTQEGRVEFITDLDLADFIKEHAEELKGRKVTVTGKVNKDFYNGKARDRFVVQSVFIADDNAKTGLKIFGDYFFTKDSFDTAEWNKEHKLIINGYTQEFVASAAKKGDKDSRRRYVPRTLVFDCSKVDFDNEIHVKHVKYRLKQLGLDLEDGKIKNGLSSKKVYKVSAIISYINGNEEIAFDEKTLTENQRMAIDLGLKTLDDFKPKGRIYGDRVVEYKLVDFDLRGDFSDGCVELEDTVSEFEDNIYVPATEESEDEIMNKPTQKEDTKSDDEELTAESLFS